MTDRRCGDEDANTALAALIGDSLPLCALREQIRQVAATSETILISGESGTGKELVARAIHACSARASGPLVSVNCAALSMHLMESELFGHERGAFTGAEARRAGRFESASSGSLLLDEVTEIDLAMQAKLLRVLQEKSFERVGSSVTRTVDIRVLATTNRDLTHEVSAGRFRDDLYYRLAVVPLVVPPLRERRDDIPLLAAHFLARVAARVESICAFEPAAVQSLVDHDWPGNVRELENVVTRAAVLHAGRSVSADTLRPWLREGVTKHGDAHADLSLREVERRLIEETLRRFAGHRARTARSLGIGLRTLAMRLKQYGYGQRTTPFRATSAARTCSTQPPQAF